MVPWVQIYSNLTTHPKTARLACELKITSQFTSPAIVAAGMLIGLWTWAIQNQIDGDLSKVAEETIADACRWKRKPSALVNALRSVGFIDDDMHLHDWEEYTVTLADKESDRKKNDRERAKKYRDRKRLEVKTSRDGNVTNRETSHDGHVIITPQHNITNCSSSSNSSTARTPAREGDSFSAVEELGDRLFCEATTREPTFADFEKIQAYVCVDGPESDPDADRVELLEWAFRAAAEAGHGGEWPYITGILDNLEAAGVKDATDAEWHTDKWRGKWGAM